MNIQPASQPTLRVDSDPNEGGFVGVTVFDISSRLLKSLDTHAVAGGLLQSVLRVSVVQTEARGGDDLPDVGGRHQIVKDELRFVPHFPFERGLSYRASFDPRPLGHSDISEVLALDFALPRLPDTIPTIVQHIFPSSDCLPENLLRFYVGFSNSMQRGRAEAEIVLLGPDGHPASDVLYRAPVELWDRKMRYLTILLDPGRLKRGVGPNCELGPPLKTGQEYELAVGAGMLDFDGRRLTQATYKRFRVTEAVRESISVEQWKVVPPVSRSRDPLILMFPRPLDWAILRHAITVVSSDEQSIDGGIMIDQSERRWSFTPSLPWESGSYQVRIAPGLEDVCGNSILAAFDRPIRSGSELSYEEAACSLDFYLV